VRLHNHSRNCIKIAPCANNTLLERILEQEQKQPGSFVEYLSRARWIHLSSLSDFNQFEAIMQYVAEARRRNPEIRVSMDPGFEYTSVWRTRLQPLVSEVDYIFLNKAEKKNLGLNPPSQRELYANLAAYFSAINPDPGRTLIIKYDDRHELLSFEDGKCRIRTVRHRKLYNYQLNNDTGAGDSFAGGFISGMLFDRLNQDIAGPIQMGVVAAKGRMQSFDYENPYANIQRFTGRFIDGLQPEPPIGKETT
jgi:sugar/nucleoside kinase (ribokinase family)